MVDPLATFTPKQKTWGERIVWFTLLLLALWFNRPGYIWIRKDYKPESKTVQYTLCQVSHKWGTTEECSPQSYVDFNQVEYMKFKLEQARQQQGRWKF